ncbi:uncharacterized protein Dmoj_GI26344, isoform B [Drosophila mojavensis]|uniref:Uncharacterized protein, isoform B n=1 Tax=Drosophila mojavensis TaxID=7230 RepID=A0A0Q9X9J3_DROMO|nr:uncharacterized protein Dmoj_GI26344, isoform B [Drosophila mojavensis]
MWRICSYTQLEPIINGCKRCQLPVEVNSNIRGKSSSCTGPSQSLIPKKSLIKKEPKQREQKVKFKGIPHSIDNQSDYYLRNGSSSRKPPVKGESHTYAQSSEKSSESNLNKTVKGNVIKRNSTAERKSKIEINRCLPHKCKSANEARSRDPFESTDDKNDEKFYDCQDISSRKIAPFSGLVSNELKSQTKNKCQPLHRALSDQPEQRKGCFSSKLIRNTTKSGNGLAQHGFSLHSAHLIEEQDPHCIHCEAKSCPQRTYMLSGTLRCTKCHARVANDQWSKNAVPAQYQLDLKNISVPIVKRSAQPNYELQNRTPSDFCPDKRRKHLNGPIPKSSVMYQPLPLLEDALRKLRNDPSFTLSAKPTALLRDRLQEYNKELFNAVREYDGIAQPNRSSTSACWPTHPKSWNKDHIMQCFREDQSSFNLAKQELRNERIESNADSLYFRVKQKSSELWPMQPLRKKLNIADQYWKSVNEVEDNKSPKMPDRRPMKSKLINKCANDNNDNNYNSISGSANANSSMHLMKNSNAAFTKPQLTDLRCHKSNSIKRIQDNAKMELDALSDNNSQTQQQKLSKEFDDFRFDDHHSIRLYVDYIKSEMSQIDNIINKCRILKRKYGIQLEDNCAEYLQQMFKRNNNVLQEVGSMLHKRCLDAIGNRKNQFVVAKQINIENVLPSKFTKSVTKNKCEDDLERVDETAKANHEKLKKQTQATEESQRNAKKSLDDKKESLPNQCRKTEKEKKLNKTEKECDVADLQNAPDGNIKMKAEVTERNQAETQNEVVELNKQLEEDTRKKEKLEAMNTDKTVGDRLKKDILAPFYMLNDALISTIFQGNKLDQPYAMRRLESERPWLGSQNQRGFTKSVGILDALGIPHATRLDSINYMFEFRNRFNHSCQQLQFSTSPEEDNPEPDEVSLNALKYS